MHFSYTVLAVLIPSACGRCALGGVLPTWLPTSVEHRKPFATDVHQTGAVGVVGPPAPSLETLDEAAEGAEDDRSDLARTKALGGVTPPPEAGVAHDGELLAAAGVARAAARAVAAAGAQARVGAGQTPAADRHQAPLAALAHGLAEAAHHPGDAWASGAATPLPVTPIGVQVGRAATAAPRHAGAAPGPTSTAPPTVVVRAGPVVRGPPARADAPLVGRETFRDEAQGSPVGAAEAADEGVVHAPRPPVLGFVGDVADVPATVAVTRPEVGGPRAAQGDAALRVRTAAGLQLGGPRVGGREVPAPVASRVQVHLEAWRAGDAGVETVRGQFAGPAQTAIRAAGVEGAGRGGVAAPDIADHLHVQGRAPPACLAGWRRGQIVHPAAAQAVGAAVPSDGVTLDRPVAVDRVPDQTIPAAVADRPDEGGGVGRVAAAGGGTAGPLPLARVVRFPVVVRGVHGAHEVAAVGFAPLRPEGVPRPCLQVVRPLQGRVPAAIGVLHGAAALLGVPTPGGRGEPARPARVGTIAAVRAGRLLPSHRPVPGVREGLVPSIRGGAPRRPLNPRVAPGDQERQRPPAPLPMVAAAVAASHGIRTGAVPVL